MLVGIDASRANKIKKTGTEWYSYHLIQAMKKIVDPKDRFVLYSKEPLRGRLKDLSPNFKSRVLKWLPKKAWTHLRLSFEMLINPPDILFIPAHVIPLIHPKKVVVTCHDLGFEVFPELYLDEEVNYQRWAMNFHLKHAAKIIAVSEFTKKEIVRIYNADPEKISVVHIAYDNELYRPIKDKEKIQKILKKYNIKPPYIFYIGRLEKKKNILGLIEAFFTLITKFQLSAPNLVLAGLPGYGFNEIKKSIKKYNLEKKVNMPSWIEEKDMPYLFNNAELFVFPSFYEGFGIPILQAMACGTPVIASDSTSIPEVAENAAILFNPANSKEITKAMKQVLENKELREDLRKRGLERVKSFSWEKCAKETLKVLKSCSC